MAKVIITPTEIVVEDDDGRHTIDPEDLVSYHIWNAVEFEGDVTLRRIFEIVEPVADLWTLILQEHVKPLIEEMNVRNDEIVAQALDLVNDHEPMEYLEVHWDISYDGYEDKDGEDFNIWPSFHGWGSPPKDEPGYEDEESIPWGVGFTPVNQMGHLPIHLNTKVRIRCDEHVRMTEEEKERDRSDPYSVCNQLGWEPLEYKIRGYTYTECGDRNFTVLEVFKGIFWELTWYGTPENRDAKADEIRKCVDEIRNGDEDEAIDEE